LKLGNARTLLMKFNCVVSDKDYCLCGVQFKNYTKFVRAKTEISLLEYLSTTENYIELHKSFTRMQ